MQGLLFCPIAHAALQRPEITAAYDALPARIRKAVKSFALLDQDPKHPSSDVVR